MNKLLFTNITSFSDVMVDGNYKNTKKKIRTSKTALYFESAYQK
jgi:hypothetical protein